MKTAAAMKLASISNAYIASWEVSINIISSRMVLKWLIISFWKLLVVNALKAEAENECENYYRAFWLQPLGI